MSLETEFAREITKKYEQGGWTMAAPEDAVQQISFKPDLLFKKGDQHLVVEIKREGFSESRATDFIKKMIETDEKWRFEIRVIPKDWGIQESKIDGADITTRIGIAEELQSEGHANEAFILLWTVIEATLRLLLGIDIDRTIGSSTLIREAYEEGVIVDAELRELQAALQIRNRLVHGLRVEAHGIDAESIANLAKSLFGRVGSSASIVADIGDMNSERAS